MKLLFFPLLLIGVFLAYQQFKPAAPPQMPPPMPAILSDPVPMINSAELANITKSTEDQDPNVRWEAALLLDKMKSPQAPSILFRMLHNDVELTVRLKAIELLSSRSGPDVLNALVRGLRDREPDVRRACLGALEKIGDYSVAGAIASGPIKDPEESVRLQALKTLNALQDKKHAEIEAARALYEQEKAAAEIPK